MDPALVDASGDPTRQHPEQHTVGAPAYLHSEGKATLQDAYLSEEDDFPTEEELATLPRVPARIPWKIFTVRFSSRQLHVRTTLTPLTRLRLSNWLSA